MYDIKFHIVWIFRYCKSVLYDVPTIRLRYPIREICKAMDVDIIKGHVSKNHVRLMDWAPPHVSVSAVLKRIKGRSSRKLLRNIEAYSVNLGVDICGSAMTTSE